MLAAKKVSQMKRTEILFNSFPVDSDAFNFMSAKDKRIGNLNIKRHKAAVRTSPNEQYLFFWYTEPLEEVKALCC